eukprot:TRINITY_DN2672_c0_g1_i1.p1 TRINITY_DN2672_c0_g1~~TRINITY_DN2672_c0_g1_i1.p1  ORF type:complete len:222 (-),score=36.73 TRINITY_DN2672_c0_g1_i1:161-826(-)
MANHYRLVVVGSGGVGKSCLTIQYIANRFIVDYDPTLEDSYRKQVEVDDKECVLDIIDTAGQDDFMAIRESYYLEGEGFLCVYDITSSPTFMDVEGFHSAILRVKVADKVPFILVGNKSDLENKRKVSKDQAQELAGKLGCKFMETSAKSRENVDGIFMEIVRETMSWKRQQKGFKDKTPVNSSSNPDKKGDKDKSTSEKTRVQRRVRKLMVSLWKSFERQ